MLKNGVRDGKGACESGGGGEKGADLNVQRDAYREALNA